MKLQLSFFRFLILSSLAFGLVSCSYFFPKTAAKNTTAIDTVIDFKSVDAYPLFPDCKGIPDRDKQKVCFQIKMSETINKLINAGGYKSLNPQNDTLMVILKVLRTGNTRIVSVHSLSQNAKNVKLLDSILKQQVTKIPTLQPAIKRGITVTTQFELPIIIKNATF